MPLSLIIHSCTAAWTLTQSDSYCIAICIRIACNINSSKLQITYISWRDSAHCLVLWPGHHRDILGPSLMGNTKPHWSEGPCEWDGHWTQTPSRVLLILMGPGAQWGLLWVHCPQEEADTLFHTHIDGWSSSVMKFCPYVKWVGWSVLVSVKSCVWSVHDWKECKSEVWLSYGAVFQELSQRSGGLHVDVQKRIH